jgi:alpha-mannosidase II
MKPQSVINFYILILVSYSTCFADFLRPVDPTYNIPKLPDFIDLDDWIEKLPFDNLEGGHWRQGWDIVYNDSQWSVEHPLTVHICMHSHNDPGWQATYEEYFKTKTKNILDTIVESLSEDPTRRFIWAEISFFSLWWNQANDTMKQKCRHLLENGQFEIVTGGWVMNDEACVHYLAMLNQLTLGHDWLAENLPTVKPQIGWAIDPFGHSSTMAYLLHHSGFKAMIINRIHYYLKKILAWNKKLEFNWRQQWETNETNSDIWTHVFPFFAYDIAHTCGPNPKVCSVYEFVNLATLWGDSVVPITPYNIEKKAEILVDQYKKKAVLFKSGDQVLVPLGDDFRYYNMDYMNKMLKNFEPLFKHINDNPQKYKVRVRWSTLSDYLQAVADSALRQLPDATTTNRNRWTEFFPTFQGDFFTYDDVGDDYWAGYYTSRPFWKALDRKLEPTIRGAEIMHVWARTLIPPLKRPEFDDHNYFKQLNEGRKLWALFQHHDAITGTSRKPVVIDYGRKLHKALWIVKNVTRSLIPTIVSKQSDLLVTQTLVVGFDDRRGEFNEIIKKEVINIKSHSEVALIFYNSLTRPRNEIVEVHVDDERVGVLSSAGTPILSQLSPVFESDTISRTEYRLHFCVSVPPLGIATYFLTSLTNETAVESSVTVLNAKEGHKFVSFVGNLVASSLAGNLFLENDFLRVEFDSKTGVLSSLKGKGPLKVSTELNEDFLLYNDPQGGAYLFLPEGRPTSLNTKTYNEIRIVKGPLVDEVTTILPSLVQRTARLYKSIELTDTSFVEIETFVSMTSSIADNKELITKYSSSSLRNGKVFYTDNNGLHMKKRIIRNDKPTQFNYYPITETVFLQDKEKRFSVHSSQPLGVGATREGEIEILLDRRLVQDDRRGLGDTANDNVPLVLKFHLTLEPRAFPQFETRHSAFRTLFSLDRVLKLNNPIELFIASKPIEAKSRRIQEYWNEHFYTTRSLLQSTGVFARRKDIHITAFKSRNPQLEHRKEEVILQFFRYQYDDYNQQPTMADQNNMANIVTLDLTSEFSLFNIFHIQEKSLTLMYDKRAPHSSYTQSPAIVNIKPMEFKTFIVSLYPSQTITTAPTLEIMNNVTHLAKISDSEIVDLNDRTKYMKKGETILINGVEIMPERHSAKYAIVALLVFVASSILVVVTTIFGKRQTFLRFFGIVFLISNFVYILLIIYVLQ